LLHHTTPYNAVGIIKGGIFSHAFANRVGTRLGGFPATQLDDGMGNVSLLVSPFAFTHSNKVTFIMSHLRLKRRNQLREPKSLRASNGVMPEVYAKVRIAPRDFMGILIGRDCESYLANEIVEAASRKGIPVYSQKHDDGRRIWPETGGS
ncbi:MAG: hypothetical protein AABW54_04485, partial [Candidatus Micrarchaeota archaeon]